MGEVNEERRRRTRENGNMYASEPAAAAVI